MNDQLRKEVLELLNQHYENLERRRRMRREDWLLPLITVGIFASLMLRCGGT